VSYYDGNGADVTAAVTGAGQVVTLAVNAVSDYTLRVTPGASVPNSTSFPIDVSATLSGATAPGDTIEALTQCMSVSNTPTGVSSPPSPCRLCERRGGACSPPGSSNPRPYNSVHRASNSTPTQYQLNTRS